MLEKFCTNEFYLIMLQCLLHVSSAYVNSNKSYAMEKIYDAPGNYFDIINHAQTMDAKELNGATDKLVIFHFYDRFIF